MNFLTKQKQTHRLRKQTYGCQGTEIERKLEMDVFTQLSLKWRTNKDLLYGIENSVQCYGAVWMGGEFGGEEIHVYVWLSPFTVPPKIITTLLIGYNPMQNKKFFIKKKFMLVLLQCRKDLHCCSKVCLRDHQFLKSSNS